jgi:steroid 5-alpha reductase family enzyme
MAGNDISTLGLALIVGVVLALGVIFQVIADNQRARKSPEELGKVLCDDGQWHYVRTGDEPDGGDDYDNELPRAR